MRTYGGVEVWLHAFLTLAGDGDKKFSFTPRPPYSRGKSPRYPLDRRLGEPLSRSGRGGEKKTIPGRAGNGTPVVQSVA